MRRVARRHWAVAAIAFAAMLAAAPAPGQSDGKVWRLGHLAPLAVSIDVTRSEMLPELAALGFVEGRNLMLDARFGAPEQMPELARALVEARPDAIVAIAQAAIEAAATATRTIPILTFGADPSLFGLAASHVRPGGNVTGVVILGAELDGKRLHLLHEAVPDIARVAALLRPPNRRRAEPAMHAVAARTGLDLLVFDPTGRDYRAVFDAIGASGARALVIGADPEFYRDAEELAALALELRLPTVCQWADMAHAGCLIGFGPDRATLRRRLAHYVAHVFRGTAPAELPIEMPTHFEFAVNLRTARALGIGLAPAFLARAGEVIE